MNDKDGHDNQEYSQSNKSSRKQRILELPPFQLNAHKSLDGLPDDDLTSSVPSSSERYQSIFKKHNTPENLDHVKYQEITNSSSICAQQEEETQDNVEIKPLESASNHNPSTVSWGYSEGSSTECDKEVSEINRQKSETLQMTPAIKSFELDSYLSLSSLDSNEKDSLKNYLPDQPNHSSATLNMGPAFSGECSTSSMDNTCNTSNSHTFTYPEAPGNNIIYENISIEPSQSSKELKFLEVNKVPNIVGINKSLKNDDEVCNANTTDGNIQSTVVMSEDLNDPTKMERWPSFFGQGDSDVFENESISHCSNNSTFNNYSILTNNFNMAEVTIPDEETQINDCPRPPNHHRISLLDDVIFQNIGDVIPSQNSSDNNSVYFQLSGQERILIERENNTVNHNEDHGLSHLSESGEREIHAHHHSSLWNDDTLLDDEEILNDTPNATCESNLTSGKVINNSVYNINLHNENMVPEIKKIHVDITKPNFDNSSAEYDILDGPDELAQNNNYSIENDSSSTSDESFSQWLQKNGFRAVESEKESDSVDQKKKRASWEYVFDDDNQVQASANVVETVILTQPCTSKSGSHDYPSFIVMSKEKDIEIENRARNSNDSFIFNEPQSTNVTSTKDLSIDHLYLDALKILDEESSDYNIYDSDSAALVVHDTVSIDSDQASVRTQELDPTSLHKHLDYNAKDDEADYSLTSTYLPKEFQNDLDLNELIGFMQNELPLRVSNSLSRHQCRSDQRSPSITEFDMLFEHPEDNDVKMKMFLSRTDVVSKDRHGDVTTSVSISSDIIQSNSQHVVKCENEQSVIPKDNESINDADSLPKTLTQEDKRLENDYYSDNNNDSEIEYDIDLPGPRHSKENEQECLTAVNVNEALVYNCNINGSVTNSLVKNGEHENSDILEGSNAPTLPLRENNARTPEIEDFKQEMLKCLDEVFTVESIHNQQPFECLNGDPLPPPRPSLSYDYENTNSAADMMPFENTLRPVEQTGENEVKNPNHAPLIGTHIPPHHRESRDSNPEQPSGNDDICTCPRKNPFLMPNQQPKDEDFCQPEEDISLEVDFESISNKNNVDPFDRFESTEDRSKESPGGNPVKNINDSDASPLKPFGSESMEMICPYCRSSVTTDIVRKPSLMFACCIAPLFVDRMKNVEHYCPQCKTLIGKYTWRPF